MFLDPACGCGNFLVVSYRELRLLEIEVIDEWLEGQKILDIDLMVRVNVDQFFGIEIEEFPAQIAKTSLWLMDHLMNNEASKRLEKYIVRIPITATPNIIIDNALKIDWENLIKKDELNYIMGNPPFVGYAYRSKEQNDDMDIVFKEETRGHIDYVASWFRKASYFIENTNIKVAFVSTNSICQGEQVTRLWKPIIEKEIYIDFGYRSFIWSNEARGNAAVHCVIIGFSNGGQKKEKQIFETNKCINAKNINQYLLDAPYIFIEPKSKPISDVPEMCAGHMPRDGGNLLFDKDEYEEFIKNEPNAKKYLKRFLMGYEFINNITRYCLWLINCPPDELKKMPYVMKRLEKVKQMRKESNAVSTKKLADTPQLFGQYSKMKFCDNYLALPKVSSERRKYIPVGFFDKKTIPGDKLYVIPNATIYHFGILNSNMHMAWTNVVCGRLKSDYQYLIDIVYNNFVWPNPTEKQKTEIEKLAQDILDTRTQFSNSSLADLYDPITMPPVLLKAHQKLDKAVENAYGKFFDDDSQRVAYLFELYQEKEGELFKKEKIRNKKETIK